MLTHRGDKTVSAEKSRQIVGIDKYQRVGWALGVGDLNGDVTQDLVITAPFSFKTIEQQGAAYVFYGGERTSSARSTQMLHSHVQTGGLILHHVYHGWRMLLLLWRCIGWFRKTITKLSYMGAEEKSPASHRASSGVSATL